MSRVNVFTGQRYSVLLTTTAQDAGTTFYIRAAMVTKCWAWVSDEVTQTALGIIRVLDSTGGIPQGTPTTQDWQGDVPNNGTCVDHDRFSMPPLVPENVPTQVAGRGFFRFILGVPSNSPVDYDTVVDKTGFFVNSIFWRNYPWKPILNELVNPTTTIEQFNIADAEFNNAAWYDIVLVNQDVNPAISHPVHLHGAWDVRPSSELVKVTDLRWSFSHGHAHRRRGRRRSDRRPARRAPVQHAKPAQTRYRDRCGRSLCRCASPRRHPWRLAPSLVSFLSARCFVLMLRLATNL